jgi:hypothetical protein
MSTGEKEFTDENQREKFVNEKHLRFIVGNEIDPETIFINDEMKPTKYATYVDRKPIDDYKDLIISKSKKKEFYKNNILVRNIFHLPFTGGTTIGRVILYKF